MPFVESVQPNIAPIDLGCTAIVPIRWSSLGFIAKFEYTRRGCVRIEEKAFPAHVIEATTSGRWTFHGTRGVEEVGPGTVLAGLADKNFGCAHSNLYPNSALQAVLLKTAIDEDVPPFFKRQILPSPDVAPAIKRALLSIDNDDFDSQMFELFHWFSKRSLGDDRSQGSAVTMQRAKRFIEQNVLEDVGLKDIASAVGLSPFVCVRQFKQATGMTPYAYPVHRRVLEAKRVLLETDYSIEDVAKRTGFKNFSYFCRFFKRSTGVTPMQFRMG